jgi:hypothetical protein
MSSPLVVCDSPEQAAHYHILSGFISDPALGRLQNEDISYKNVNKVNLDPYIIILVVLVYFISPPLWFY